MRSVTRKQNLNRVPCVVVQYKFLRAMFTGIQFREVGEVTPVRLKHQLTPFVVFLHFSNF